jgi:hypothetical protein
MASSRLQWHEILMIPTASDRQLAFSFIKISVGPNDSLFAFDNQP